MGWYSHQYSVAFCVYTVLQMSALGQFDKMVYNMEVQMEQMCGIKFLHVEKMVPVDIH